MPSDWRLGLSRAFSRVYLQGAGGLRGMRCLDVVKLCSRKATQCTPGAHSCHQHDAPCRVISRLEIQRDEASERLVKLERHLPAAQATRATEPLLHLLGSPPTGKEGIPMQYAKSDMKHTDHRG
ncbi:unnamed protein product [Calypogeia fissa]